MKRDQEALSQYTELAAALADVGMGWVVDELEEDITQGKAIQFRELSQDENMLYERRLTQEARKGFSIGRAKAGDSIGVPYAPEERLALLVDAAERVIITSERSHAYLKNFASRHNISAVVLLQPVGADILASAPEQHEVSLAISEDIDERLAALHRILHDEVLD
jgi:hypothetical protein